MPIAHVKTFGRVGIRCFPITVEIDVSPGLPAFTIVGLPDAVVQESKERIRAAIKNTDATFPLARITVNLAPADVRKEGVGFDFPIAIGILIASEQIPPLPEETFCYGELGLEGNLKLTRGVLSFALNAKHAARIYVPHANRQEAGLIDGIGSIYSVASLKEFIFVVKGESPPQSIPRAELPENKEDYQFDFADVHGQESTKRALEIAAAGHHNILLSGPPGAGKTLLSRSLPGIMPPLTREEIIETTEIYSIAGLLKEDVPIVTNPPFRSPHHSSSLVSLVGGSNPPRPGEITLAHNGILFIDEFAELPRNVIEALRQPLEDRVITVARAGYSAEFPAHCLLVAAVNPCPCGYKDDPRQSCLCTPQQVLNYRKKLSGPILDRIDMHITVPPVRVSELSRQEKGELSTHIKERVARARAIQEQRYKQLSITNNSELPSRHINAYCILTPDAREILEEAIIKMNLSARAYHKVIKVSRTIADLSNQKEITVPAVAEALQYRSTFV